MATMNVSLPHPMKAWVEQQREAMSKDALEKEAYRVAEAEAKAYGKPWPPTADGEGGRRSGHEGSCGLESELRSLRVMSIQSFGS